MRQAFLVITMLYFSILSASADLKKGIEAYEAEDYATALSEFQPLADQGVPEAQSQLSRLYYHGYGVRKNYKKAGELAKAAAEKGDKIGENMLGLLAIDGLGTKKDLKAAEKYFLSSAEKGFLSAQLNLAGMYWIGDLGEKDYKQALYWYHKAAKQGSEEAFYRIGYAYMLGLNGTETEGKPNLKEAYDWFHKGAVKDDPFSQILLAKLVGTEISDPSGKDIPHDVVSAYFLFKKAEKPLMLRFPNEMKANTTMKSEVAIARRALAAMEEKMTPEQKTAALELLASWKPGTALPGILAKPDNEEKPAETQPSETPSAEPPQSETQPEAQPAESQ